MLENSAGRAALQKVLNVRKMNQARIARLVDVGADVVGRWIGAGTRQTAPKLEVAYLLEQKLGILTEWWALSEDVVDLSTWTPPEIPVEGTEAASEPPENAA